MADKVKYKSGWWRRHRHKSERNNSTGSGVPRSRSRMWTVYKKKPEEQPQLGRQEPYGQQQPLPCSKVGRSERHHNKSNSFDVGTDGCDGANAATRKPDAGEYCTLWTPTAGEKARWPAVGFPLYFGKTKVKGNQEHEKVHTRVLCNLWRKRIDEVGNAAAYRQHARALPRTRAETESSGGPHSGYGGQPWEFRWAKFIEGQDCIDILSANWQKLWTRYVLKDYFRPRPPSEYNHRARIVAFLVRKRITSVV